MCIHDLQENTLRFFSLLYTTILQICVSRWPENKEKKPNRGKISWYIASKFMAARAFKQKKGQTGSSTKVPIKKE